LIFLGFDFFSLFLSISSLFFQFILWLSSLSSNSPFLLSIFNLAFSL
jgi:hypothetical protein